MTVLDGPGDVRAAIGSTFGPGDWLGITAEHITGFASATGTTDPTFLPVSLSNLMMPRLVTIVGFSMGVNYGTGEIRFGSPVAAGHRVRAIAELNSVDEVPGGLQTTMLITIEIDGETAPACTIQSMSRWLL